MSGNHQHAEYHGAEVVKPRFDRAHPVAGRSASGGAAAEQNLLAAVAGRESSGRDQLGRQASELVQHLRERHRQLARREASLNAWLAEHDAEQRAARLWLQERQEELDGREAELQQQREQLEHQGEQSQQWHHTAQSLSHRETQLRQSEQAVEEQRQQLRIELDNVQQQQACLEAACDSWRQQAQEDKRTLDQLRHQLLEQRQANEQLNSRLREQLAQNERESLQTVQLNQRQCEIEAESLRIQEQQGDLEARRQALARDQELQLTRTAEQRQRIAAHWQKRHRQLQRERDELNSRRQKLREYEEKVRQQQNKQEIERRDLLERELVVEQAKTAASSHLSAQELSKLEHLVRQQVQREFATTETAMAARGRELHQLAGSLRQQRNALENRYAKLHADLSRRQRELEAKAY